MGIIIIVILMHSLHHLSWGENCWMLGVWSRKEFTLTRYFFCEFVFRGV